MFADQSPEQWARDHLVFVIRVAGPNRYGAEGEVLGIASVLGIPSLRSQCSAPRPGYALALRFLRCVRWLPA